MNQWINGAADRVTAMASEDEDYQEVLQWCRAMEREYMRIMQTLPEKEQLIVDDYIALREQMQYRMTQLAYELGVKEGAGGAI